VFSPEDGTAAAEQMPRQMTISDQAVVAGHLTSELVELNYRIEF
jgi:hypothetical protein